MCHVQSCLVGRGGDLASYCMSYCSLSLCVCHVQSCLVGRGGDLASYCMSYCSLSVCVSCTELSSGTWRRSRRLNTLQVKQLQDGEAIHTALANSPDPLALQVCIILSLLPTLSEVRLSLPLRRHCPQCSLSC